MLRRLPRFIWQEQSFRSKQLSVLVLPRLAYSSVYGRFFGMEVAHCSIAIPKAEDRYTKARYGFDRH